MLDLPVWVLVAVMFNLALWLASLSRMMSNARALRELESIVLLTSATIEAMHNHLSSLKRTEEDHSQSLTQNTSSNY
jgi:MFS superfamily sulfate permease-like transporter